MSDAKKRVVVTLTADAKQFQRQIDMIARDMAKVGKQLQAAGREMTMAITAPLAALGTISVISYDKQVKAIAQIEAGLRSTGNAAGFTSEELQKMASDLQKKTLFGDEEILRKATAQLLTFTTIARGEFERAQVAAMNLATRLDGDLQAASIMVGKALNDPIRGLTAMGRAGVQFTQDQKDVIKSLWEAGKQAEAQRLILAELEKQYGGSAEAAAKAGLGGFTQMKNALGDLGEEFGKIIVDAINPLVARVQGLVAKFQAFDDQKKKNIVRFAAIAAAIGPVLYLAGMLAVQFSKVVKIFTAFRVLTMSMVSGINLTTAGVTTQIFGVQALSAAWSKLTLAMKTNIIVLSIGLIVGAISLLKRKTEELDPVTQKYQEQQQENARLLNEEQGALRALFAPLQQGMVYGENRKKLIETINSKYKEYLPNLLTEKSSLTDIADAYNMVSRALIKNISLKANQQKLVALGEQIYKKEDLFYSSFANKQVATAQEMYDALQYYRDYYSKGIKPFALITTPENERSIGIIKQHEAAFRDLENSISPLKREMKDLGQFTENIIGLQEIDKTGDKSTGGKDVKGRIDQLTESIKSLTAARDELVLRDNLIGATAKNDEIEKLQYDLQVLQSKLAYFNETITEGTPQIYETKKAITLFDIPIPRVRDNIKEWGTATENTIEVIKDGVEPLHTFTGEMNNLKNAGKQVQDVMVELSQMLEKLVEDQIANFATALGQALGGNKDAFKNFGTNFLLGVADFAEQFGKLLIGVGISIAAFESSLKSLDPLVAIAAGTALIAAAALTRQLIANKADEFALGTNFAPGGVALVGERGPELVHLPRGSRVTPNMQTQGLLSTGNLFVTLKGSDIQIALDRTAKRQRRYA